MLIAVINVQFHLFQEAINQFTVVIALDNTNQIILTMTDHQETTEVQDIQRDDRPSRNSRDNDREDTTVTCADCGDQCTVPFVPRSNKPVYCSDCFRQYKPDNPDNDRPSRDDRGSIQETTDHQETTEVQDIQETTDHQETTEVQDIQETTEVQEILEIILDLGEKVIKF